MRATERVYFDFVACSLLGAEDTWFILGENVVPVTCFSPNLLMIEIGIDDINAPCVSVLDVMSRVACLPYHVCPTSAWWKICVKHILLSYVA